MAKKRGVQALACEGGGRLWSELHTFRLLRQVFKVFEAWQFVQVFQPELD